MPLAAVGRLVGEHDTRLWRVLHHDVEEARGRMDVSEVKRIGCHHQGRGVFPSDGPRNGTTLDPRLY
jgi:hypothetical protein